MPSRRPRIAVFLACLLALCGAPRPGRAADATLAPRVDRIVAATPLVGTHLGIVALDPESGATLYARNADDTFVPGSLMKLFTGIAALRALGPDYRFLTRLTRNDGVYTLRGGGDPQITRAVLREAVRAARAAGAAPDAVLRVDDAAFANDPYPVGWTLADRAFDYAAPITALSVDENALHFTARPTRPGAPPALRLLPEDRAALAPAVALVNRARTVAAGGATTIDAARFDPADTVLPIGATAGLGVSGAIAADAGERRIDAAVPYPRAFLAELLARYARAETAPPGPTRAGVVWTHRSKPLAAMLSDMWLDSDNFIAECWLRALGGADDRPTGAEAAVEREIRILRDLGVAPDRVMIVDGSGLSRQNAASPRAFAAALRAAYASNLRETVRAALPVAGRSGTLRRRFRGTPLEGAVFAKTGSLTNVSNIAGYLRTARGRTIVFGIFADDALIDDAPLHALQARILLALQDDRAR